jgi:hypothetical protein
MKKNEIVETISYGAPAETGRTVYEEIPFTLTFGGNEYDGFVTRITYCYEHDVTGSTEITDVIWNDEEPAGITAEMIDSIMEGALEQ